MNIPSHVYNQLLKLVRGTTGPPFYYKEKGHDANWNEVSSLIDRFSHRIEDLDRTVFNQTLQISVLKQTLIDNGVIDDDRD